MITAGRTLHERRSSMAGPLTVEKPQDLAEHVGKDLGPSDWITVDQAMIDKFAEATGDHQWIHVDVERAKKEMPGGKTIAHGYLTLSLLPRLVPQLLKVEKRKRGLNYGSNKIRFTNTVPAGSRIRLKQTIKNVEDVEGNGVRITSEMVMEVEGQERPALIAETLGIQHAERAAMSAAKRTAIRAGFILAFDGSGHRLLRDGVVVIEGDHIL